jgi:hypothetical protein
LRDRGFRSPDRLEAAVYAFAKVNVLAKGKSKRIFAGKRLAR